MIIFLKFPLGELVAVNELRMPDSGFRTRRAMGDGGGKKKSQQQQQHFCS